MSEDDDRHPLRPRRRGTGVVITFAATLALAAAGVGAIAQAGAPDGDGTADAAAPAPAAPATTTSGHGGMDMGGGSGASATTTSGKPATPAARTQPYGTHPLAYTVDHGVKVFHLTAAPAPWRIEDSTTVQAWTYNGQVPGPVIRPRVGDRIRIVVTNHLPEPTTIHWHGVNLPISQDGVPGVSQKPIAAGASFTYEFTSGRRGSRCTTRTSTRWPSSRRASTGCWWWTRPRARAPT